ncbi:DUF1330 domain-containing protein [Chryseobacterium sp. RG1]|uniref:DUF1330 domain-containing protein n=1 Tax=Chryseobacterium tagetis TaxID=2801334 RepID=A0ABS8A1B8_9FLAO|nr:DUF1330 domain-containing protein [Chryseobacterium tagetis]MCA6067781.1 DUF1330 domain-containing protein [Chryseobacterium tagetis]
MPAYIIFTRTQTLNIAELEKYWSLIQETMKGHPIEVLVPYGDFEILEGEQIEGIVVAKFPDMEAAKKWYSSEAYKKAALHRQMGAIYNGILVEGIA